MNVSLECMLVSELLLCLVKSLLCFAGGWGDWNQHNESNCWNIICNTFRLCADISGKG